MISNKFSILITTKNRLTDLAFTLEKIKYLLVDSSLEIVIFDDGSTDGTYKYLQDNFPNIQLERNPISRGYLFCRNKMLNKTKSDYAISLDDDAHFITNDPLELINQFFDSNPKVGVVGFRVFWSKTEPETSLSNEISGRMKSFVGCAHVWRMKAWREIPNYPEWFKFYGEEDFASYQLFKKGWEVHYLPEILVNHRVNIKERKSQTDYRIRLQRSLHSGWCLIFLFYPLPLVPRRLVYSIWKQLQLKVLKGDFLALKALLYALYNLVLSMPTVFKERNSLTKSQFQSYQELQNSKIYWEPNQKVL